MIIKTSKGTELECEAITSIQTPQRLYLHLVNIGIERATQIMNEELPIQNYPLFTILQSIASEGSSNVKVSLRTGGF